MSKVASVRGKKKVAAKPLLTLITALLFILLFSTTAFAIELTPTKRSISFLPGEPVRGTLTITNTESVDMTVAISARGELAQYISIDEFVVDLPRGSAPRNVGYTLTLPEEYATPGPHEAEIVIIAASNAAKERGATVGTTVSLATKVIVRIPYPGKYAEARIEIEEADVNDSVRFLLPVSNLGKQDIVSAEGTISVLGPTSNRIASVKTPTASIRSGTAQELIADWVAAVEPGLYVADAAVTYDGELATAKRQFAVGSLFVDVLSVTTSDFKIGGIAKINLVLRNTWNNPVDDVYVRLVIYDEQDQIIYDAKSSSIDLAALQTGTANVFWDTAGLRSGAYRGELTVHYADRTTKRDIDFAMGPTSLTALLTGQVLSTEKASAEASSFSLLSIVLIGIVALIIVNVFLFVYLRSALRRMQK